MYAGNSGARVTLLTTFADKYWNFAPVKACPGKGQFGRVTEADLGGAPAGRFRPKPGAGDDGDCGDDRDGGQDHASLVAFGICMFCIQCMYVSPRPESDNGKANGKPTLREPAKRTRGR